MRHNLRFFALILLLSPLLNACDSDSSNSVVVRDSSQTGEETDPSAVDAERDSEEPGTAPSDTTVNDEENDEKDADASSSEHILECSVQIQPSRTSYVCPEDESQRVSYTSDRQRIPPPEEDADIGPSTVEELRASFGGSFPPKATVLTLAEDHHPDAPLTRGFAEPGEDVTIHFSTVHLREHYGDSKLKVSALLNYRPVDGIYRHYNHDRSKILKRHDGTGATIPIDGEAELVDITIPAEAFDGPGRYDIGLGYAFHGAVDNPSGWDRIVIYYGGCSPPSHECLVRGTNHKENEAERAIADEYFVGGFVYPGGEHEGEGPFEVQLDEGGRVTVNFSLPGRTRTHSHAFAAVPMLLDKPLDKRFLVVTPPKDLTEGGIGYRGSFEVEIPDQPGRYDVEVGIWSYPFLEPGDYPDLGFGTIERTNRHKFGTNDVVYVVK